MTHPSAAPSRATSATSATSATDATTSNHRDATHATARRPQRSMRVRSPANWCSERVLDAALRVHRTLGPGLLASAYRQCLALELEDMGLTVRQEVPVAVVYRGMRHDPAYRIDLLVGELVIVEVKSVAALKPVHSAQLLTYLRHADYPLGMLLNFNAKRLMDGYVRMVNKL